MSNHEIYISGVNYESLVDGPGVRAAIFLSGCSHGCPGCHNPEAQNPRCGQPAWDLLLQIADEILRRPFLQGITLTGGDPMYYPSETNVFLASLLARLRAKRWYTPKEKDVWLYTGYTWEEIMLDPYRAHLALFCDVVVDGPFVQNLADRTLQFRGSSNQRMIDVYKSTEKGKPVLWTQSVYQAAPHI